MLKLFFCLTTIYMCAQIIYAQAVPEYAFEYEENQEADSDNEPPEAKRTKPPVESIPTEKVIIAESTIKEPVRMKEPERTVFTTKETEPTESATQPETEATKVEINNRNNEEAMDVPKKPIQPRKPSFKPLRRKLEREDEERVETTAETWNEHRMSPIISWYQKPEQTLDNFDVSFETVPTKRRNTKPKRKKTKSPKTEARYMNEDEEKPSFKADEGINCDDFASYALNCTIEAALLYNSTRKSPPLPSKFFDWCRAIRLMTTCAIDWNNACKHVTESHFSHDSVKGHVHVLNNVCDDEPFAARYEDVWPCIENTIFEWEECYTNFKKEIDEQKSSSQSWTHYDTHFKLCCARAQFRACTLDILFQKSKCTQEEAVTLQKFSVIVSEGDVYQDCDQNVMYDNCPGGDPRPPRDLLLKLTETEETPSTDSGNGNRNAINLTSFYTVLSVFYLVRLCCAV
ncbi:hypothetical protein JYU34_020604 [Plutella xylostella]|uniref:Uncharacterized protein n=1 Tax=Plutella xylostella TaxID=51655 RepID=A0ABQ7PV16_PLUXY|nr:hypothetical protein JYU34_020604 [Plutella xylostella]